MVNKNLVSETAYIVSAYVSQNKIALDEVAKLVRDIHQTLSSLAQQQEEPVKKEPVVPAKASVKPDYLVCLECGAKQKTLKRHLQAAHRLSPDQYRERYSLGRDYPMTAPEYSKLRSGMAKQAGLGRQERETTPVRKNKAQKATGKGKSTS